jgi:hypothetical protein
MMPEQIWILLLFLVVVLFNLITGFLNRRRERDASETKKAAQPAPRAPRVVPARVVTTPPGVDTTPVRLDRSPPAPQRRRRAKLGRDELRRAIVVMTLVSPPRALIDEGRDLPR